MKKTLLIHVTLLHLLLFGAFAHAYSYTTKNKQQINDTLPQEYKILSDSNFHYDFGESCYILGKPPLGRKAIETLRFDKRIDLIKAILNGNNKEGRIYAIEALLEMHDKKQCELTQQEKDKIKLIILSNSVINRCQGNDVGPTTAIILFNEERYKKLLKTIM